MKITFLLLTIGSLLLSGCKTNYAVSSDYTHEIECMGSEPDGSINLQTWSKGKSPAIALARAEKNVIKEVLFKGIRDGQPGCDIRPILNTPNIRESEAEYFNSFFRDGGTYEKFVTGKKSSFENKDRSNGKGDDILYGFVIRVLKSDLTKQMIKDGLLK